MIYLVGQIVFCLFFTALIGATMGWLLRGLGTRRQTETVEARWRERLSRLQQEAAQHTTALSAPEVVQRSPAAEAEIASLKKQVQQRDEALESLRMAQSVRPPEAADAEALASQARDTAQINTRLQGHLAEQKAEASQLKNRLDRAHSEKEILIERLRDRETEIGRMSQERQHAINTIAKLQKEMRAMRAGEPPVARTPAPSQTPAGPVENRRPASAVADH